MDPKESDVFVREGGRAGLVQYSMFLIGDSEDIRNLDRLTVRTIFKEFTAPATLTTQCFENTDVPTIAELHEVFSSF